MRRHVILAVGVVVVGASKNSLRKEIKAMLRRPRMLRQPPRTATFGLISMKGIGLLLRLHTCDFNIEAKMKSLFTNKRFALNEKFHRNASKFAIFYV